MKFIELSQISFVIGVAGGGKVFGTVCKTHCYATNFCKLDYFILKIAFLNNLSQYGLEPTSYGFKL